MASGPYLTQYHMGWVFPPVSQELVMRLPVLEGLIDWAEVPCYIVYDPINLTTVHRQHGCLLSPDHALALNCTSYDWMQ